MFSKPVHLVPNFSGRTALAREWASSIKGRLSICRHGVIETFSDKNT